MIRFKVLILSSILFSCSPDPPKKNQENANKLIVDDQTDTISHIGSSQQDSSNTLNQKDKYGLKQGKWTKIWRNKIIESAHYKNDTLHGYFISRENGGGYEGNYVKGRREGLFFHWYSYKKSLLAVTNYQNDIALWSGYPAADERRLFPVKGFHIYKDSLFIRAPYENGKIWYEGNFCLKPDTYNNGRLMTYAYGTHKIYFRNGKTKGIVDYDNETIREFDSLGKELYSVGFDEKNIHNQGNPRLHRDSSQHH